MEDVMDYQLNREVLSAKDCAKFLGIGESSFWRHVKNNEMPRGRKIGKRRTFWLKSEILEFLINTPKI